MNTIAFIVLPFIYLGVVLNIPSEKKIADLNETEILVKKIPLISRLIWGLVIFVIYLPLTYFLAIIIYANNPIIGSISTLLIIFLPYITYKPIREKLMKLFSLFHKKKQGSEKSKTHPNSFTLKSNGGSNEIRIDNLFRGALVVGGAGSGKSASILKPIMVQAVQKGWCGIIYDFKFPELAETLHHAFALNSSPVKPVYINFSNVKVSARCNPLSPKHMAKTPFAIEYAQTIIHNLMPESIKRTDYWIRTATNTLAGVFWYLKINHPEQCTLPHAISLMVHTNSNKLIEMIAKDDVCAGLVASTHQAIMNKADQQLSGIMGTLQTALAKIATPEIYWVLSANDFDLDINDPDNPNFVCLGNDPTISDTLAPIISLLLSVMAKQMNKPNKWKSMILIDEAPTLYIPNFEQIPATARSNKIASVLGAQDFSQMIDRYGPAKTEVLLSNLGNQFYGRTTNNQSAERIARLFGKQEEIVENYSMSDKKHSMSVGRQMRNRVELQELLNLYPGQFYGFIAEGSQQELLKIQLSPFTGDRKELDNQHSISDQNIIDNYKRIVAECRNIAQGRPLDDEIILE